jgi:hypothetical protein
MGVLLPSHPGADGFWQPRTKPGLRSGFVSKPLQLIVTELQTYQQAKRQLETLREFSDGLIKKKGGGCIYGS